MRHRAQPSQLRLALTTPPHSKDLQGTIVDLQLNDCNLSFNCRKCRFYLEFKRCKFGDYCRFSHEVLDEIKELKKEAEFYCIQSLITCCENFLQEDEFGDDASVDNNRDDQIDSPSREMQPLSIVFTRGQDILYKFYVFDLVIPCPDK